MRNIELHNGTIIEVDTDGVFFVPPDNVLGIEEEQRFIEHVSAAMPKGITLAFAGRFRKMLSYKKKNYALVSEEGELIVRGSSLISRALELFARRFLRQGIELLLAGDLPGLHALYLQFAQMITTHAWGVVDFCRSEILHDALSTYDQEIQSGSRKPSPAYEAARRSAPYLKPGSRISYYVTGSGTTIRISDHVKLAEEWDPNFPDENSAYYLSRLDECAAKFEGFFEGDDFRRIFSQEDLFDTDLSAIRVVTRRVEPEDQRRSEPPEAPDESGFGIWLDGE